ncbi:MAG: GNAT family N-acetyltransferase [Candidatus Eremiobacteraeota bacterium]|nr:GNAT family N-acetyltransferase [Candidatus Eremiobacteraeota bacterium]
MFGTQRLNGENQAAALAYLSRAPIENVFLTYLILFDVAPATRDAIHLAIDERSEVCGVGYFGRQIAIAAQVPSGVEALVMVGREHRGERMIVGPRNATRMYWESVAPQHEAPRLLRDRQLVMTLDRKTFKPASGVQIVTRKARIDEWTAVADNSAAMIAHELEYDPRASSPAFTANVRAMIDRGLWWVGESYGRLCFYCNVGPWSPQTAQLQGIWTPPEMRGRGLATCAMSGICDRLLAMSPTLSLYVNDFNDRAIALYERIGFRTTGEFQTILF